MRPGWSQRLILGLVYFSEPVNQEQRDYQYPSNLFLRHDVLLRTNSKTAMTRHARLPGHNPVEKVVGIIKDFF